MRGVASCRPGPTASVGGRIYRRGMPKMIRIPDLPESVHAALASRADARGLSFNAYLFEELTRIAAREPAGLRGAGDVPEHGGEPG